MKYRFLGPTHRGSAPVGLRQNPSTCLYNKLPGDAEDAGLWTTLGEALLAFALLHTLSFLFSFDFTKGFNNGHSITYSNPLSLQIRKLLPGGPGHQESRFVLNPSFVKPCIKDSYCISTFLSPSLQYSQPPSSTLARSFAFSQIQQDHFYFKSFQHPPSFRPYSLKYLL